MALLCRSHVVRNHATLVTGADGVTEMPVRSAHCYLRTRFRRESARLPDKLRAEMNSTSTHTGGVVTTDNDLAAGQSWAYRARQVDDVVEVEVLKLGRNGPRACWSTSSTRGSRAARSGCRRHGSRFNGRQSMPSGPARPAGTGSSTSAAVSTIPPTAPPQKFSPR